jgi:RNA recognition motif-containing protein
MTNKPKGFAFITYSNRQDAEKAIEKYNSHRMHHLVMKVEWTKSGINYFIIVFYIIILDLHRAIEN